MSWQEYAKIDTINARDIYGNKRLMEGTFRDPAIEYMKDVKFKVQEKADGTNVSIHWDGHHVSINGRTASAQLPKELLTMLEACFMDEQTEQVFEQLFPPKTYDVPGGPTTVLTEATIYGEGIGPKIQKVGKLYGDQYRFLVFDIKVGNTYLEHSNPFYAQIIKAFGVEEVPTLPDMTPVEAIEFVKSNPKSWINSNAPMEGVVLRPKVRLYGPNGDRLIVKVKAKDYAPYSEFAEKYRWIKQGKCVVFNNEVPAPDSRTLCYEKYRCTIRKIHSDSGKIENENTMIDLREIDSPIFFFGVRAHDVEPYNKEKWNENQANHSKGPENGN